MVHFGPEIRWTEDSRGKVVENGDESTKKEVHQWE